MASGPASFQLHRVEPKGTKTRPTDVCSAAKSKLTSPFRFNFLQMTYSRDFYFLFSKRCRTMKGVIWTVTLSSFNLTILGFNHDLLFRRIAGIALFDVLLFRFQTS